MAFKKHNHGGQLQVASKKYQIPIKEWIDLSTGINPNTYPLPPVPNKCWQRLPETDDGLETAATAYYGSKYLLAVSGSQEAIQTLPLLFSNTQRVGIVKPAYHSHQQAWEEAGHDVVALSSNEIDAKINKLDILIIVNPTNPSTESFTPKKLHNWHQQLKQHNGLLIIDEAFMDATPENSLIKEKPEAGLMVLRSIGKFFGLAGIRLGFVWAEENILMQLATKQHDWSVSHPARWAGKIALEDKNWQQQQKKELLIHAQRLVKLLEEYIFTKPLQSGGVYFNTTNEHVLNTHLFAYFQHPRAKHIHEQLAQHGLLTRLFEDQPALRFGLPANEKEWERLAVALDAIRL